MRVGLVRNVGPYGHVHREDCLARGYGMNLEPWTLGPYEAGTVRGLDDPLVVQILAEAGEEEPRVRFCDRCLPDVKWKAWEIRRARRAAERLGVVR